MFVDRRGIRIGATDLRAANLADVGYGLDMHPVPALLPLETLPSWPAVYQPTVLEMLTLTVFIPFGIAAVFAVVILGPSWRSKTEN